MRHESPLAEQTQEQGSGSRAEDAYERTHDVIGMLEPDALPETLDVNPDNHLPSC